MLLIPAASLHLERLPPVIDGMAPASYLVINAAEAGGELAATGVPSARGLLASAEAMRAAAAILARGEGATATLATRVDATYTTLPGATPTCARDGVLVVTLSLEGTPIVLEGRRAEGPRTVEPGACPRPHHGPEPGGG